MKNPCESCLRKNCGLHTRVTSKLATTRMTRIKGRFGYFTKKAKVPSSLKRCPPHIHKIKGSPRLTHCDRRIAAPRPKPKKKEEKK